MKEEIRIQYEVVGIVDETPSVRTVKFKIFNDFISHFTSGQFINIYFPEFGNEEGKSYSISSTKYDKTINISVKKIGNFSSRIFNLKIGDKVTATLPYGYFYTENSDSKIILIAGGIGIAPFRSMIFDFLKLNAKKEIILYFSCQKFDEIIFKNDFDKLATKFPNFKVNYYVTRDKINDVKIKNRRIDCKDIEISEQNEYFICGSIQFVRDFWRNLKSQGISEEQIYTESFF